MKNKRTKVKIPHGTNDLAALINNVYEKHQADGANSLLKMIVEHTNVDTFKQRIDEAMLHHKKAEEASREMEKQYAQRDILLKPLVKELRRSAQFLKSFHCENTYALCLWGFDVQESRPHKKKKVAAQNNEQQP